MTKRMLLPALAGLVLAGCQPGGEQNDAANAAAAEPAGANSASAGNVQARVIAMSDRQRNVVFIRALLDAGINCQEVTSSERLPDRDGKPLWRANCSGGTAHMISITPDGTANIVSRTDR
jgi:hypothetical protein